MCTPTSEAIPVKCADCFFSIGKCKFSSRHSILVRKRKNENNKLQIFQILSYLESLKNFISYEALGTVNLSFLKRVDFLGSLEILIHRLKIT